MASSVTGFQWWHQSGPTAQVRLQQEQHLAKRDKDQLVDFIYWLIEAFDSGYDVSRYLVVLLLRSCIAGIPTVHLP